MLTVPLAALDSVMPEDGGFYVCVGVAVWVADADGSNQQMLTSGMDERGADHPRWVPQQ